MFEHLRNSDNATLAVPQLLDKAAGFFMGWLDGRRGRADAPARGGARAGKSMAHATLGYGLFRLADYQATAMPPAIDTFVHCNLGQPFRI